MFLSGLYYLKSVSFVVSMIVYPKLYPTWTSSNVNEHTNQSSWRHLWYMNIGNSLCTDTNSIHRYNPSWKDMRWLSTISDPISSLSPMPPLPSLPSLPLPFFFCFQAWTVMNLSIYIWTWCVAPIRIVLGAARLYLHSCLVCACS